MNGFTFEVREDLVYGNYNEDGDRDINSVFYVVAEDPNGRRFGGHVTRTETTANGAMMALRAGQVAFDPADGEWEEIEPAYGSRAYQGWQA